MCDLFFFCETLLFCRWISGLEIKRKKKKRKKKGSKKWPFLSSFCILWNTVLQCPKVRKVVTFCLCALLFSATMKLHLSGRVLNPIFTQGCDETDWEATSVSGLLTFLLLVKKKTKPKQLIKRKFLTVFCHLTILNIYRYFGLQNNSSEILSCIRSSKQLFQTENI